MANRKEYEMLFALNASFAAGPASTAAASAIEAVSAPGYSGSSITVEVHIHLEGNASTDTVQALEDYVSRGELKAAVMDAMEEVQADRMMGAYV